MNSNFKSILFCLSAGILWGIIPLYINLIEIDDPYEIIAQRALWSSIFLFFICWFSGQLGAVWVLLKTPRTMLNFFGTTLFLTLNWGIYVYAVQSDQVVAAALGYFIYPLCTVLLGILLLGERLDKWAWCAIALVFIGVLAKAVMIMDVPWISLMLAGSFSFYAVLRKRMNQDPVQGMFVETLLLLPVIIGFLVWMVINDQPLFFGGGTVNVSLAIFAGVMTVVPLVLFHTGNRALNNTTSSLVFYSNPTTQLLIGVMVLAEVFDLRDLSAFGFIWVGIAVYFATRRRVAKRSASKI